MQCIFTLCPFILDISARLTSAPHVQANFGTAEVTLYVVPKLPFILLPTKLIRCQFFVYASCNYDKQREKNKWYLARYTNEISCQVGDQSASSWLRAHPGRVITELEIGELFKEAYGKSATVHNATSGFAKSGICPFNENIFTEKDFIAAQVTERPDPHNATGPSASSSELDKVKFNT